MAVISLKNKTKSGSLLVGNAAYNVPTWVWRTITADSDTASAKSWPKYSPVAGLFITCGQFNGYYLTSSDATTWTARTFPSTSNRVYGIAVAPVGASATEKIVVTTLQNVAYSSTSNGTSWTSRTLPSTGMAGGTYNGSVYAVGGGTAGAYSSDGITWTSVTLPASIDSVGGNDGPTIFGQPWASTTYLTSTNGSTWTSRTFPTTGYVNNQGIQYGNGTYVWMQYNNTSTCYYSTNGTSWTSMTMPSVQDWVSVTYGQGYFVASSNSTSGVYATSPDGITWTSRTVTNYNNTTGTISGITFGNGIFTTASGYTTKVYTTP